MRVFIFFSMLFCHILDDFFLQTSWLSNGKCRSWWETNASDPLYRYDYLAALIIHSYSWSFMTLLPVAVFEQFQIGWQYTAVLVVNGIIHAVIDHFKVNMHKINLITDQSLHLIQIIAAFLVLT